MSSAKELQKPLTRALRIEDFQLSNEPPDSAEDYEDVNFQLAGHDRLETQKVKFIDCHIGIQTAIEWVATLSNFRSCAIEIGRVGSLELTSVTMNSVEISNVRAGYVNLGNAKLQDVVFKDCRFDSLDLFATKLKRVSFQNCHVTDLDVRKLEAEHADLRGLSFDQIREIDSLRGATINEDQLMQISKVLAINAAINVA